jgi:hypothetical protein
VSIIWHFYEPARAGQSIQSEICSLPMDAAAELCVLAARYRKVREEFSDLAHPDCPIDDRRPAAGYINGYHFRVLRACIPGGSCGLVYTENFSGPSSSPHALALVAYVHQGFEVPSESFRLAAERHEGWSGSLSCCSPSSEIALGRYRFRPSG